VKPIEYDPLSGHATTGHEWDGISELNTPVPKIALWCLLVTFLFGIGYWLLMPSWPLGRAFFPGLLGMDDRREVQQAVAQAQQDQHRLLADLLSRGDIERPLSVPEAALVRQLGGRLFGDNCAACHGVQGKGTKGFPDLTATPRLWGESVAGLEETIRYGINSAHAKTRVSQMPAFGRDRMLTRAELVVLADYVAALPTGKAESIKGGAALYEANCVGCHGEKATGNPEMGAPNLTDPNWLYGGRAEAVFETLWQGRQGQMPGWSERLSAQDIALLALYVRDIAR
jgi:cytochrome c oxidase cbb3-type subunit III